jgi:hypothetical protein
MRNLIAAMKLSVDGKAEGLQTQPIGSRLTSSRTGA